MAQATLKEVANFFRQDGETLSQFSAQWKELPEKDREELRQGIGDGSLTY